MSEPKTEELIKRLEKFRYMILVDVDLGHVADRLQQLTTKLDKVREAVSNAMFFSIHKKPEKALEHLKSIELDLWPDEALTELEANDE